MPIPITLSYSETWNKIQGRKEVCAVAEIPPWGRAHRRLERLVARELAKMRRKGSPDNLVRRRNDLLGGLFVAVLLMLISPKLSASLGGEILTVFLLVVLWVFPLHFI